MQTVAVQIVVGPAWKAIMEAVSAAAAVIGSDAAAGLLWGACLGWLFKYPSHTAVPSFDLLILFVSPFFFLFVSPEHSRKPRTLAKQTWGRRRGAGRRLPCASTPAAPPRPAVAGQWSRRRQILLLMRRRRRLREGVDSTSRASAPWCASRPGLSSSSSSTTTRRTGTFASAWSCPGRCRSLSKSWQLRS